MHSLEFNSIWRDFNNDITGDFNEFLFKYVNKNKYSLLLFEIAQQNYMLGVYLNYLSKLYDIDKSLIDEEEVKDLLSYDFSNIDNIELNKDSYLEYSKFYLDRSASNEYIDEKYNDFEKGCRYFLLNKEYYPNHINMYLNNEKMTNSYTRYIFDDIEKQQYIYKFSSNRLKSLTMGNYVQREDYSLLFDTYKRIYLKNRIYDDILPLCKDNNVDLDLLSNNFNIMLDNIENNTKVEVDESKENVPFRILNDYIDLSNKLDNNYKLITNNKNKILKK